MIDLYMNTKTLRVFKRKENIPSFVFDIPCTLKFIFGNIKLSERSSVTKKQIFFRCRRKCFYGFSGKMDYCVRADR